MRKELIKQLKGMKEKGGRLSADPVWLKQNKDWLLKRIQFDQSQKEHISSELFGWSIMTSGRAFVFGRSILTVGMAIVLSIAGWIASVSASYNSLPGDVLYNIKIATEKTQIAVGSLVGGSERKAELLNNAAKTRAYETKELVAQKKLDRVDKSLESLKVSVDEAQNGLTDVGEKKPKKATAVAADLNNATQVIADALDEAVANAEDKKLAEKIVDVKHEVTVKGIDAVESVVNLAQEKGEATVSGEEVGQLVKKAIDNIKDATEKNSEAAEELKKTLSGSEAEEMVIIVSTSTLAASSTLLMMVPDGQHNQSGGKGESAVGMEAVAAVNKVVKESLAEAKQMAEDGQLKEALDKARDLSTEVNILDKGITQAVAENKNKTDQPKNNLSEQSGNNAGGGLIIGNDFPSAVQSSTPYLMNNTGTTTNTVGSDKNIGR